MFSFADVRARFHYRLANGLVRLRWHEAAANAYGRVLQIWQNDPGAEFQRAWCLLMVPERRAEGIGGFQRLMQRSPSADGYFLMACGLQQESRDEEAIVAFRESIRLENPSAAELYYNLGVSLSRLQRWEEAAGAYENAAHLNPTDADAWVGVGSAYAMLSRWKDALPCYERARRLSPTSGRGVDAAYMLYELNRLEEAAALLREAVESDPDCADTKELLALTLAGLDRHDESIQLARDICAADEGSASPRATLALVLIEAGQADEALIQAKAAIEMAPLSPDVHAAAGDAYLKLKDGAAALAAFERAAACLASQSGLVHPSHAARLSGGRGTALSLLGRHDEAMVAFNELLRVDPDFFARWPERAAPYELSRRETKGSS